MKKILKRYFYLYPLTVTLASLVVYKCMLAVEKYPAMGNWFIILGGAFPILLSLAFKINTGEHIKEQLTVLIISVIMCVASWYSLIYLGMTDLVILYVPAFCVIAAIVYWIIKIHEIKQCVFLIISNPIMYYTIYLIVEIFKLLPRE